MTEKFEEKKLQAGPLRVAVADNNNVLLEVIVKQSIDSTNNWSLQQCKSGRALPFACFAEVQTQGRGRRGKQWLMLAGNNIAMSLAWSFTASFEQLNLLPLSVAMAIVETLEDLGLEHVQVKWPNDVYVRGQKIAGILLETQVMKAGREAGPEAGPQIAVVIGVGLNYDMSAYESDDFRLASLPLTDICSEVKSQALEIMPQRTEVVAKLLQNIVRICQNYPQHATSNLNKFRQHYDYCNEKWVDLVLDNNAVLSGVAQGVNSRAELLVLIDGQQQNFNSAEVSVRTSSNFLSAKSDAAP